MLKIICRRFVEIENFLVLLQSFKCNRVLFNSLAVSSVENDPRYQPGMGLKYISPISDKLVMLDYLNCT